VVKAQTPSADNVDEQTAGTALIYSPGAPESGRMFRNGTNVHQIAGIKAVV
jgi:hypothetical protein